jgi:hypothetical protein
LVVFGLILAFSLLDVRQFTVAALVHFDGAQAPLVAF